MEVIGLGAGTLDETFVVSEFPSAGSTVIWHTGTVSAGGATMNSLVCLQQMGCTTRALTVLGNDVAGLEILRMLRLRNVDVQYVIVHNGAISRSVKVFVRASDGERAFVYKAGSCPEPKDTDWDLQSVAAADLVIADEAHAAALAAARLRKALGRPTVANIGWYTDGLHTLLRFCTAVVFSGAFLRTWVADVGVEKYVERLVDGAGLGAAVVTSGAEGSVLYSQGRWVTIPAFHAQVVDTTGAGDAYTAGLGFGLLRGWMWPECALFGSAVAASACEYLGGNGQLPPLTDIIKKAGLERRRD